MATNMAMAMAAIAATRRRSDSDDGFPVLTMRRTPGEWGIRSVLALLASVLGYISVSHTLAMVELRGDPARAHRLAPSDGRITSAFAEQRLRDDQSARAQPSIAELARQALRQDPAAVRAVGTLGLQAQQRGQVAQARRLFAYAERLSRRDLKSQLWLIEDAVSRGDIFDALRHYDIALRTSKNAPDLLFPVLANAIADPMVRANLVTTLARRPIWGPAFIGVVAASGNDPRAAADLLMRIARARVPVSDEATMVVINRLIGNDATADAWRYYAAMRPGMRRDVARDTRFTANLDSPSAFDWTAVNGNNVATSIQSGSEGGVFDFSVSPGVGGVVLQQTQLLPAGIYRIEGHSEGIEQPDRSLPYWVLSCRNGRELGRVVVPASAKTRGTYAGQFVVPRSCPVQTLALIARPSDAISGVTGQLDLVRLFALR